MPALRNPSPIEAVRLAAQGYGTLTVEGGRLVWRAMGDDGRGIETAIRSFRTRHQAQACLAAARAAAHLDEGKAA